MKIERGLRKFQDYRSREIFLFQYKFENFGTLNCSTVLSKFDFFAIGKIYLFSEFWNFEFFDEKDILFGRLRGLKNQKSIHDNSNFPKSEKKIWK